MKPTLTAEDLAPLDTSQKEAVLSVLYTALIADGVPNAVELAAFTEAIKRLPWGQPLDQLQTKMKAVQVRIATGTREDKIKFLQEVVPKVPVAIRVHVVETMLAIVTADKKLTAGEKGTLTAYIVAFGLTQAQVEDIKAKLVAS